MSSNITLDALERKVQEIQALSLIYNEIDDEEDSADFGNENDTKCAKTSFKILTIDDFNEAQNLVENYQNGDYSDADSTTSPAEFSSLRVELHLVIDESDEIEEANEATNKKIGESKVHFTLPPNYLNDEESSPILVSVVSIGNMNRSKRDEVTKILNEKAQEYAESSSESIMLLIQDLQDAISCIQEEYQIEQDGENDAQGINDTSATSFSRRWIWVHHITNSGRIESIVQEANDLSLNGYLKSGYPGVCVVEGLSSKCDQFVQWIKGNKSRPGGFGRQWGHHVRGQIEFQEDDTDESSNESGRGFTNEKFEHVGEELGDLADKCRNINSWMEDEFKAYVMQH